MAYLISVTENYRIDSEEEVQHMIDSAKESSNYTLTKYNCTHKEAKQKGEVVDEWFKVSLTKTFTNEREPDVVYNPVYEEG